MEAARELGCDEAEERFLETVRKVASAPPAPGPRKTHETDRRVRDTASPLKHNLTM